MQSNIIKHFLYKHLEIQISRIQKNPRYYNYNYGLLIVNNQFYNIHHINSEDTNFNYIFSIGDIPTLSTKYAYYFPLFLKNNMLYIQEYIKKTTNFYQIGWYVLPYDSLQMLNSFLFYKKINGTVFNRIFQLLKHEIEIYNAYRNNIYYNYKIINRKTNTINETSNIGLTQIFGIPDTWLFN